MNDRYRMTHFTGTLILFALMIAGVPRVRAQTELREALKDSAGAHWIYDDFPEAVKRAEQMGRPLLVLFRCVP
jgi:hypothetical protein